MKYHPSHTVKIMLSKVCLASFMVLLGLGTGVILHAEQEGQIPTPGTAAEKNKDSSSQNSEAVTVESVAKTIMERAAILRQKGKYAEANAAYIEVIGLKDVTESTKWQAQLERINAAIEKAEADDKAASEQKKVSEPQKNGSEEANKAARSIMDEAARLVEDGRYDDAITAYADLAAQTGISEEIKSEARLQKTRTIIAKAKAQNPGVLRAVWDTVWAFWIPSTKALVTLVLWIIVLAVVVGIVILFQRTIPARKGLLIDVQDLSVTDHDNGSRVLSSEIAQMLSPPADGANDELIFESMKDFEGGGSASIRPITQLPGLDSLLAATASPIAIGPIQFTPASLLALLRRLVQPRYERTLTGALLTQSTRLVMAVQMTEKSGHTVPNAAWQFAQNGTDAEARQSVLRKVAARMMILQADGKSVTADGASMEAVLEGIDRISASTDRDRTPEKLRGAAACFQAALDRDPDNWLARFNISVLSRQLGDNEFAIQNCEMLEQMIQRNHPPSLAKRVKNDPSFPAFVRYNRALALSKIPTWDANKAAVALLDEVIGETKDGSLEPLAKSAKAAALLFQFLRYHEAGSQAEMDEIKDQILQICEELQAVPKTGVLSRGLALARAVALNAKGFLLEAKGDSRNARESLEEASALQPNFVDPHINLGRLYRRGEQKVALDWVVRAKGHLDAALALQPENRDANYQMGRLLACEALLRYADALECFEKAAPHSMAAFFAAKIYLDSDFPGADLAKGIDQLRTSVRLATGVDFRLGMLADRFLDAAQEQCDIAKATPAVGPGPPDISKILARAIGFLDEAERAAKRMTKRGDDAMARWAAKVLARAEEIRKQLPA